MSHLLRIARDATLALCVLAGPGCGASYRQLPDTALRDLPVEGKRWLYDAENTVVAALDNVDVARESLREADERIAAARRSIKAAEKQRATRGTDLGVKAAEERLRLAEAQRELAQARVELALARVRKARLDLELDKARLVVNYDLVAERGFTLQPFEAQATTGQADAERARQAFDAQAKKLEAQVEKTREARKAYIAQTNDHDSGVWLD